MQRDRPQSRYFYCSKADARYPSKESVDLRFSALEQENATLKAEVVDLKQRINRMSVWMYKSIVGVSLPTIGSGIVLYIKRW